MASVTVYKRDHHGERVWSYAGEVIARGDTWVCLQARFNGREHDAGYVVFRRGDLFTEWFFADRWYNIFRLEDAGDGHLKGWYCNITRPAHISDDVVEADDLALDVFVKPSGEILVLDREEFDTLDLPEADRRAALRGLDALCQEVAARRPPFDSIGEP